MKQFWNIVIGSFVGVWIALMLFSIVSFFMSFALMSTMSLLGKSPTVSITDNSVLRLDLGCVVNEQTPEKDINFNTIVLGDNSKGIGLDVLLHSIEVAKSDSRIAGIYIECNGISAGTASLYEIRKALVDFKTRSNKFIYAYGDYISQSDYYLASVADSIFINTIGNIDLNGLSVTVPMYKNLMDKIGVEVEVVRVGTFKSAVEPYILSEISDANRLQYKTFIDNIWGSITDAIASSRNITATRLNEMADSIMFLQKTQYLIDNNLADAMCYKNDFDVKLKSAVYGGNTSTDINFLSPNDLKNENANKNGKNIIAVVYAVGEIDGVNDDGIDSEKLSETILNLAEDDDVKGVVLRVNSPGGSAYGSEQIWHALEKIKEGGKPYAVSMSDLAASGGYYISCGADRIFAEPTTLTGSIGVFGLIPYMGELFEDKIGITFSSVKTNKNSGFPTIIEKMTPSQRVAMQYMVNETYELFVKRCAEGRGMSAESIKTIAEGRIWDGISALNLNLVDEHGNLEDAIKWVADKANLSDYGILIAPEKDDFLTRLISKYTNQSFEAKMEKEMGPLYKYHKEVKTILSREHILCLTPEVVITN